VPGTYAAVDELRGLGAGLAAAGAGVFEVAPAGVLGEDLDAPDAEVAWMRRVAEETGRPVTFALLQHDLEPEAWVRMLDLVDRAQAEGIPLRPQVAGRPLGLLLGLQTFHPFSGRRSFQQAAAGRTLPELVAHLRQPAVRAEILAEASTAGAGGMSFIGLGLDRMFPMGEPPDYEPAEQDSVAARAQSLGRSPEDLLYDMLLEHDSATAISLRSRSARCFSTRPAPSAWATAVLTAAPSAMPARPPTC
jgi:N-acyl-D-aspartate/D-glutamate deacylase